MEKQKIILSIPNLGSTFYLTEYIIEYRKQNQHKFNDDVIIGSVYGNCPCIWNGGRPTENAKFNMKEIEDKVKYLNDNGITARFAFTNLFITGDLVNDYTGNLVLNTVTKVQKINNDVNTGTDDLRKHIEEKYPNLNVIYSTTMCIQDIKTINKITEKNMIVPDYRLNNNFEKLKQLTHPENIELLANESCEENCIYRKRHYENISKGNLGQAGDYPGCFWEGDRSNYYRDCKRKKHYISLESIRKDYLPLGINKFKILGRDCVISIFVEGLVDYLIKPEYQEEVRQDLLKRVLLPEAFEKRPLQPQNIQKK